MDDSSLQNQQPNLIPMANEPVDFNEKPTPSVIEANKPVITDVAAPSAQNETTEYRDPMDIVHASLADRIRSDEQAKVIEAELKIEEQKTPNSDEAQKLFGLEPKLQTLATLFNGAVSLDNAHLKHHSATMAGAVAAFLPEIVDFALATQGVHTGGMAKEALKVGTSAVLLATGAMKVPLEDKIENHMSQPMTRGQRIATGALKVAAGAALGGIGSYAADALTQGNEAINKIYNISDDIVLTAAPAIKPAVDKARTMVGNIKQNMNKSPIPSTPAPVRNLPSSA